MTAVGDFRPVGDVRGGKLDGLLEGVLFQNQVVNDLSHVIAGQGLVHIAVPALPQGPVGFFQRRALQNREARLHGLVLPLLRGGILLGEEGAGEHGAELGGGHVPCGLEGAVAVAVHRPGVHRPPDFLLGPVVRREVVKARRLGRENQAEEGQQGQENFFHEGVLLFR